MHLYKIDDSRRWIVCLLSAGFWAMAGCGQSDNPAPSAGTDESAPPTAVETEKVPAANEVDPYPLSNCIVSGESLADLGEPVVIDHEGREVRFCCNDCVDSFKRNPSRFLEKMSRLIGTGTNPLDPAP